MTAAHSLEASVRDMAGTGPARAVRRDGKVPGVVYGGEAEPVSVAIELRALNRCLNVPGMMAKTIALTVDGKTETVRLQDVQRHPVTDEPLHVDFLRLG